MGFVKLYEEFSQDTPPTNPMALPIPKRKDKGSGMNWVRQEKRLAIYLRDSLRCVYCFDDVYTMQDKGASLTLDHVNTHISALRAGEKPDNSESNLVSCCSTCNSVRQDMDIDMFIEKVATKMSTTPEIIRTRLDTSLGKPLDMRKAKQLIIHKGSTLAVIMSKHPDLTLEESISCIDVNSMDQLINL